MVETEEYEGPIEIYDKTIGDDGEPKEGRTLSIGVESKWKYRCISDFDGNEIFKGSDYYVGGELSAEESFKLGKFLMKIPPCKDFLKVKYQKMSLNLSMIEYTNFQRNCSWK